jgi:hypothetical protein
MELVATYVSSAIVTRPRDFVANIAALIVPSTLAAMRHADSKQGWPPRGIPG